MEREEIANSLTHGVGLLLCAIMVPVLIVLSALKGDARLILGSSLYGGSLLFLYGASTGYHLTRSPSRKHMLRMMDHIGIYLLIAGSYSPFTLVSLKGQGGDLLFALIWGMALLGVGYKLLSIRRFRWFSTVYYLLMGWLAVLFIRPFLDTMPLNALLWIAGGGVFYTGGVVFYVWDRLPYHHAVWHLFVLAGSACHFVAVYGYVLPS